MGHDLGQAAVLVTGQNTRGRRQLGLGHYVAGGVDQSGVLLAKRQGLPQHGQDEGVKPPHCRYARTLERQTTANAARDDAHLQRGKSEPLGGCLPIMVQIPVFIALYWVLLSSVEMRNAPWIGWILDLSTKDPYYILPAVMTATTFIQTALNPVPPDPLQARLMWIMPMAFSVMFFFFPAGLVLYWITNNVLTILQQWQINKSMGVEMKFRLPKFK